jgi:hypothetical protein
MVTAYPRRRHDRDLSKLSILRRKVVTTLKGDHVAKEHLVGPAVILEQLMERGRP